MAGIGLAIHLNDELFRCVDVKIFASMPLPLLYSLRQGAGVHACIKNKAGPPGGARYKKGISVLP